MDFNTTVDLIIKDINEARDIIDDLKNYPGVPLIQVELAKSKCKSAAEVIALLKNLQNISFRQEQKIVKEKEPEPQKKKEEKREKETIPNPVNKKNGTTGQPVTKSSESTIFADTFGLTDRINEKMGIRREEEGVSDIINSKPLTNLSEAIGVNDRFLFIREVFSGNQEAYNQAIIKLDNAGSLEDAITVIMSYSSDNKETDAIRHLLSLVKRKFPSDE
jgi:hypothetical protein